MSNAKPKPRSTRNAKPKSHATRNRKPKTKSTRKAKSRLRARARPRDRAGAAAPRPVDIVAKAILSVEPPIDNDPTHLEAGFRLKLDAVLPTLQADGTAFRMAEGLRTTDRQQWLYGSGRPNAQPYGRPGPILTHADGVNDRSRHQLGLAADCYPKNMSPTPPANHQIWRRYADLAIAQGLRAGLDFPNLKDAPHCEMP